MALKKYKKKKVFLHVAYGQVSQKIQKSYFLPKNICDVCVFAFILDLIIILLNPWELDQLVSGHDDSACIFFFALKNNFLIQFTTESM